MFWGLHCVLKPSDMWVKAKREQTGLVLRYLTAFAMLMHKRTVETVSPYGGEKKKVLAMVIGECYHHKRMLGGRMCESESKKGLEGGI